MRLAIIGLLVFAGGCPGADDDSSGGSPHRPTSRSNTTEPVPETPPPIPTAPVPHSQDEDVPGQAPAPSGSSGSTTAPTGSSGTTTPPSEQPPTPPPAGAFNPNTWDIPAKGLWIWRWDYIGKTPLETAVIAKEAGVGYVLIKSGQDASFWADRYNSDTLKPFLDRGMRVFAWPYIKPGSLAAKIDAAVAAANVPGTDGLVLDVEVEWEAGANGNYKADAIALCDGIRAKKPGVWLAYTTFGWVNYHPGFPFKEFDEHCGDAFFPQVYWSDRGIGYQAGYDQAISALQASGLKAPVWIAQSNDDIHNYTYGPSTADLNAFFALAGARTSLWEFPVVNDNPEKLTQLKALNWANH